MDCSVDGGGPAARCRTFYCNLESALCLHSFSTVRLLRGIGEMRNGEMRTPASPEKPFSGSPGGGFSLFFCSEKSLFNPKCRISAVDVGIKMQQIDDLV